MTPPALRLVNLRTHPSHESTETLLIENGQFVHTLSAPDVETIDLGGCLVIPGLIETHLHLDKACILNRCCLDEGTLAEAIAQTRHAKTAFTEEDIYARGAIVLEKAIGHGTTFIRTHVEIDPGIGLTGFNAILRLQADYAWAVTLQICVFPQEGLLNNPGTEALLRQALDMGADVLGGCPYMDSDPQGQIERLFDIAVAHDCDLDFHLDFDLDPHGMTVPDVIRCTRKYDWTGRVTIGHATKLSALSPEALSMIAAEMANAGVNLTCLPSTDLFLTARDRLLDKPRGVVPLAALHRHGVTCSISTNNIGNPFTPYGDASLVRQANLFANVTQLGTPAELLLCLNWISWTSAQLLRLTDYGLKPGCRADFVVFDAPSPDAIVAEIQAPIMGFKAGRQTFHRPTVKLLRPL